MGLTSSTPRPPVSHLPRYGHWRRADEPAPHPHDRARSVAMRASAVLVVGLLASAAACGRAAAPQATTSAVPPAPTTKMSASAVPPDARVGALFLGAADLHTCTAAVLNSTAGDLILTAAHCVAEGV